MTNHERAIKAVAEQIGIPLASLTPTASFVGDLGCDSLDMVEIVMTIEDEFSIEIPDQDAEPIKTVGEMLAYIDKRLPA